MRRPSHQSDRTDDGFTLVEMLVVAVVLGILAAIAIPLLLSNVRHTDDAKARSDLRNLATFEEGYAVGNSQSYATAAELAAGPDRLPVSQQDTVWVYTNTNGYCLVGHAGDSVSYLVFASDSGLRQAPYASLSTAQSACTGAGYSSAGTLVNDGTGPHVG